MPPHPPKHTQANVKEARFGLDYVKGFDIVLNGLDNMDARRHVNRCERSSGHTNLGLE